MKYGYARVSTDDQKADMQHRALYRAGCRELFTDDGKSGATTNRPRLQQCLKKLNTGDTLMVWKLDRLGRSLRDLITMLDDFKQRGIKFRLAHGSNRHRNTDRPRHVANDRHTGRA